ncbi:MAG: hypothetical protein JSR97_06070 [Verrucomicrobia bacterium]|nr:hypothetical protein [Verrucomicrobiota bacterium]
MDILNQLSTVQKIVSEKIVTTDYASKEIDILYDTLLKEYAPDPEIIKARIAVAKWCEELKADGDERSKKVDSLLSEIDQFLAEVKADLKEDKKRMKQGLGPTEKSFEDWSLKKEYDSLTDFSNLDKLFGQLDTVMRLELFAKKATKYIRFAKFKFHFFKFLLRFFKAIIICLTIIASYYIGKLCENLFLFNPIYVAFISAIICLVTSDKWLGKLKDKIFWMYAGRVYNHSAIIFNSFIKQKIAFLEFAKKYLDGRK